MKITIKLSVLLLLTILLFLQCKKSETTTVNPSPTTNPAPSKTITLIDSGYTYRTCWNDYLNFNGVLTYRFNIQANYPSGLIFNAYFAKADSGEITEGTYTTAPYEQSAGLCQINVRDSLYEYKLNSDQKVTLKRINGKINIVVDNKLATKKGSAQPITTVNVVANVSCQ